MELFTGRESEPNQIEMAMARVQDATRVLDQKFNKATEIIKPSTSLGRIRHFFAKGPLKQMLIEDPLENLMVELKRTGNGLGRDVENIIREGRARIIYQAEIEELLELVETDPDNKQTLDILDRKTKAKAEVEFNIRFSPDVQEIIEDIMTPKSTDEEAERRQAIISKARLHRDIGATTKATLASLMPLSVRTLDKLMDIYSLVAEYRNALRITAITAAHLRRAQELNIVTLDVIALQMEHTIATAQLANTLEQIYLETQAIYPVRLASMAQEATQLIPPSAVVNQD